MKHDTARIRAIKRAAEIEFIQGSCNREISRFATVSPDSQYVFTFSKDVHHGHVWCKGPNITGLRCTRGSISVSDSVSVSVSVSISLNPVVVGN